MMLEVYRCLVKVLFHSSLTTGLTENLPPIITFLGGAD